MNQGPLHQRHLSSNAKFGEIEGFSIPMQHGEASTEYESVRKGAGLIDLPHVATARLEGPDARRFCNGMFTNNIRALQPGHGNRSAMCDDRGRILGLIDLFCTDEDQFEAVLEGVTAEWFESRYGLYIVFDDVELEVSQGEPWILSLQGPQAAQILQKAGLPIPNPGEHCEADPELRIVHKDRSGIGGFDLIVSTPKADSIWSQLLTAGATPMGYNTLERLRIEHGRARWPVDGTEKSLVHELGLDKEVCNFNKGCYLGQEIINRVDVKGQFNKKIHKILIEGGTTDVIGAKVLLGESEVGTVTSATNTQDGAVALAVLRKAAWGTEETLNISTQSGMFSGSIQGLE